VGRVATERRLHGYQPAGLAPGDYTVTVSYVGFAPFSDKVSVTAASFRMYKGLQFVFAGLNLTNEVFRFYAGSSVYPIQREYYKPSYEFGMRYIFASEQK
jgi:hypothetical protein